MTRVLWVLNLLLPAYAEAHGMSASVREGWLSGLYRSLQREPMDITLAIACPVAPDQPVPEPEEADGVTWYLYREDLSHPERYDNSLESRFQEILTDFRPDLVHVFGTEFPHALACLRAFGRPERSLVGIQGFCAGIAEHYRAGLPEQVWRSATFRDIVRGDSLRKQQKKFYRRAEHEREIIALAGHVTGRTAYDREATAAIHPEIDYHPMNETLRDTFYEGTLWNPAAAAPHRIFLPQGDYPLKGFHHLLQAMPAVLDTFPDAVVAVAGNSVIGDDKKKIPLFLRIGAYGRYLRKLIKEHGLADRVEVLGTLNADGMRREMLASGVFVLPSSVENSPNSMGEAMLLGMPVIASDTGGIPSLLTDGKEGILVPPCDPAALAAALIRIFTEPVVAGVYGENARRRALITHDPAANVKHLTAMYEEILAS